MSKINKEINRSRQKLKDAKHFTCLVQLSSIVKLLISAMANIFLTIKRTYNFWNQKIISFVLCFQFYGFNYVFSFIHVNSTQDVITSKATYRLTCRVHISKTFLVFITYLLYWQIFFNITFVSKKIICDFFGNH